MWTPAMACSEIRGAFRGRCDGVIIVVLGQVDEEEALAHTVVAMRESLVAVEAEF